MAIIKAVKAFRESERKVQTGLLQIQNTENFEYVLEFFEALSAQADEYAIHATTDVDVHRGRARAYRELLELLRFDGRHL